MPVGSVLKQQNTVNHKKMEKKSGKWRGAQPMAGDGLTS
jgi:hypothetical protein